MIEGINVMDFGIFGGAFFVLFFMFIKFVDRIISDNRTDTALQREVFTSALHEITSEVRLVGKELAVVNSKLDEHIRSGGL